MPLVGNLRDFALHDFLYLVDRGYKTGSLVLRTGTDSATLYFDQGKLISVARPQRHERLGELLVRTGKITQQQLQRALDSQEETHVRPIGKILVEQGAIRESDLQTTVRIVIEKIVYELFTWHEGEFEFNADMRPDPNEIQTPVPIAVENLIMEGVRRVDEMARIKERIPSNDMIVRFTHRAAEPSGEASLSVEEWRVFARIDNHSSVDELAERLDISPFEVSTVVFGLIVAGLLEVVAPERKELPLAADQAAATQRGEGSTEHAKVPGTAPESLKRGGLGRLIDRIRGS